jgi:hypoxanthine phosphoribosyltransferase
MLASYRHMTAAYPYAQNDMLAIPGILKCFDLPDISHALKGSQVLIIDPVDGYGRTLDAAEAEMLYFAEETKVMSGKSPAEANEAARAFFNLR